MKNKGHLLHRTRVTLAATIASGIVTAIVLLVTAMLLRASSVQTAQMQLSGFGNFVKRDLNSKKLLPGETHIQHLEKRTKKLVATSYGIYTPQGQILSSGGKYAFPSTIQALNLPNDHVTQTIRLKSGDSLITTIDWSQRFAELEKIDIALLVLWPALTALIALATFLSISSSFKPFYRMLGQAKSLGLNDRLDVDDQAEFGQLATSINSYLDTIETVVKQQEEFAVDAAHELCTPLTALRGNLEVALRTPDDSQKLRAAAKHAIDQVARLERLTESLLISTRPKNSNAEFCDAQEVVERSQARWLDRYTEKSVFLEASTAPFEAAMPAEEIGCVLDNLLSNALRYTPKNSKVNLALTENGALTVQDEGPGIPTEIRDKVFERFERGNAIGRGHGIGLYLAKRLVENSSGSISIVESLKGARIEIQLPAMGS